MLVAGNFAWVPHVKLPVKYLWYSGKFTCARRQCACVLREVLAASKQVNLSVITGKLHVTQVNCARDLFTCELHVKLPAFAGNFARASFTVQLRAFKKKGNLHWELVLLWVKNIENDCVQSCIIWDLWGNLGTCKDFYWINGFLVTGKAMVSESVLCTIGAGSSAYSGFHFWGDSKWKCEGNLVILRHIL